ncbi:MAG TPA: alpha/beta hydrolase [Candidatus Tetragenococcus pullicola]|nr:alpha/beta hydrolase [Candidatus Tetragenococcus pullicola]
MIQEKIMLPIKDGKATLNTYVIENFREIQLDRKRPAVIICPGGGYEFISEREAEPIAIKMLNYGFQAFVLNYSVKPAVFPQALLELASAVKMVRQNCDKWGVDPEKIAVAGFSAGGHLAASLGVFWEEDFLSAELKGKSSDWQPNALMLAYPVITSGEFSHEDSFKALLGDDLSHKEEFSLEKKVTKQTPPTFLWHTLEDGLVPAENSLLFAQALRKEDIPFALHVFPKGGHGLSLASVESDLPQSDNIRDDVAVWPDLFSQWLKITLA